MERKMVLAGVVVVVVVALLAGCVPAAGPGAQSGPIKIGALTSLSGPFTAWGVKVRDGMKFAAQELNQSGGVLGRQIEIVERDDKNSPDEAMTALRGMVEMDGIVAEGGMISSGIGLATAGVAEELKVPNFMTMSGSHTILKKSTRYTFRSCLVAAPMSMGPVTAFIKDKGYKKIGAIIADYEWGHATEDAMNKEIKPLPGVTLQIETAPVGEQDFTPYLRKLQGMNPEILILLGHPPGNFAAGKQALELGVGQFIVGSWSPPEVWIERVGLGVAGKVIEFSCADFADSTYQKLAGQYVGAYKNFFDHNSFSGYTIVKAVAEAIKKTGSTDRQGIAKTIHEGSFAQPGYAYPLSYTEWGELKQATPIIYTIEQGDPGPINPGATWRPKVLSKSPVLTPYVPAD
ncbi:MAG: ABC transporter substrate-binding protein [Dehalococcoidia bacterium]|nr:ABC transporter substrate-binding protein [Dehalococcoidia bacterium]